jgi:hypothetical protein
MAVRSQYLFILCIILSLLAVPVLAKDSHNPVPEYEQKMAEFFYPDNAVAHIYHATIEPHWIRPDAFWYADTGRDTTQFFLINISQGSRQSYIDAKRLAQHLVRLSEKRYFRPVCRFRNWNYHLMKSTFRSMPSGLYGSAICRHILSRR